MRKSMVLTALSLLLAALMLTAPAEVAAQTVSETVGSLDYSDPYSKKTELAAGELLSSVLLSLGRGETASEAERSYLSQYFEEQFYYSSILPGDLVAVETDAQEITVAAQSYTVRGRNGKDVRWVPVSAHYGDSHKALSSSGQASFPRENLNYAVTVTYAGEVELEAETVNVLLNYAYTDQQTAAALSDEMAAYETVHAAWQANQDAWAAYGEDYEAYETLMDEYEADLLLWQRNQDAWDLYDSQKEAYEENAAAWAAYRQAQQTYADDYAAYLTENRVYQGLLENQNKIRTAMTAMESIYWKPEGLNSLYTALQNAELVVMFEKYQGILTTNFGVPKADIQKIRADSDQLNLLLGEYAEARAISEEEAFAYYKRNYSDINRLFNSLYDRMSSIMTGTVYNLMCGKLDLEYGSELGAYKKWRIKNVLSHIYLICLCLDDTRTASNTWSFFADNGDPHVYYFGDLLDQQLIITDTGAASPLSLTWQAIPQEAPTPPTVPTAPTTQLTPPSKPAPAWEKPVATTPPTEPDPAWEEPALPEGAEIIWRVEGGLSGETLTRRDGVGGSVRIALPDTAVTGIAGNVPVVYGPNGEIRSDLDPYDLPDTMEPFEDTAHTYTFVCWSSSPGEIRPITEESMHRYPIYSASPRRYEVTFAVGEEEHTRTFAYGTAPSFDGTPTKESDAEFHYTFSGWNPPLQPVSGAGARYEAVFTGTRRSYEVRFDLGSRVITRQVVYGTVPQCPVSVSPYVSGNMAYESLGTWDRPFSEVTGDVTYRALFASRVLVTDQAGESGDLRVTESTQSYTVTGSGERFSIGVMVDYAEWKKKTVDIGFSDLGATVSFDEEALRSIPTGKGVYLSLTRQGLGTGEALALSLTDGEGRALSVSGRIRLTLPYEGGSTERTSVIAYYPGEIWKKVSFQLSDGVIEFWADPNAGYVLAESYRLQVVGGENGSAYADGALYRAGDKISLSVMPNAEYRLGTLTLKNIATGETVTVSSPEELVMPAYDAELLVEFEEILYTVTFLYHGGSESAAYRRGETPRIPTVEKSFEADGYFYTFTGWSSAVTAVTGDVEYTAMYYSVRAEDKSGSGEGGAWGRILLRYGLPAAAVLLVLGAAVATPLVIRKKKKKQKGQGSLAE